jgi:hypothetical protein
LRSASEAKTLCPPSGQGCASAVPDKVNFRYLIEKYDVL